MKALMWRLRILFARPGWWMATLLAALFAMVFTLAAVKPAQQVLVTAQARYKAAGISEKPAVTPEAAPPPSLQAALPSYRQLPQILSTIFATARDMEVMLDMGDYHYSHNRNENYGSYQIELPMIAEYATIRALVARLMNAMPYAALDDISLTREAVDSEIVEARIRLTLYLTEQ
jgi:hypothetical protein